MKRTNIVLDDKVIKEISKITGIKSIRGVVDHVLKEFLRREKQLEIFKRLSSVQEIDPLASQPAINLLNLA